jgi:polysaccharide deacetylase family protein (PEP-CTERM system associated)
MQNESNNTPQTTNTSDTKPLHCVSIDVEEYFHIEAAHGTISKQQWDDWPSRDERNTDLLLDLFHRRNQHGTFFILGHVAKRHPKLIKRIADAGHEIASHGSMHDRLHRLTPETFREDLNASKSLLEDQTGQPVIGYRAPTFSVVPETAWAIDILIESGFQYDASIFPVRHSWYGVPTAPDRPFFVKAPNGGELLEVPPLTWSPKGLFKPLANSRGGKLPVAGGGYFRLQPLWFMKQGLNQAAQQNRPAILYFHPWEFDPDMPKLPLSFKGRLRTYTGLKTALKNLDKIMSRPARWATIASALDELRQIASESPAFALTANT